MAATLAIILSCLVYGIVASPSSTSYLLPVANTPGGRPAVQGGPVLIRPAVPGLAVSGPAVSGPSTSYSSPIKGAARRPAVVGPAVSVVSAPYSTPIKGAATRPAVVGPAVSVISAPTVQRPVVTGVPYSVGGKRPSAYRPAVIPASTVQRPTVIGAPTSVRGVRPAVYRPAVAGIAVPAAPVAKRPYYAGAPARTIPSVGVGSVRPISSGYGTHIIGSKAPY